MSEITIENLLKITSGLQNRQRVVGIAVPMRFNIEEVDARPYSILGLPLFFAEVDQITPLFNRGKCDPVEY